MSSSSFTAVPAAASQVRSPLRELAWPLAGLTLAVLVIYGRTLSFDFLNWDDSWYVVRNDLIKSWRLENLWGILTQDVARNFAPATVATFLVEHSLWELWPGGYHASNVLLHALNAALVLILIRQLTNHLWMAWIVAALFAVHPVQVETVAWISSRKTLLSATFMLASLICTLRPDRTGRQEAWGAFWLLLGLLSKAAAVVIPPIVIAYDVLVARKRLADSIARQAVPLFFCIMLVLITMQSQVSIVGGVRGHLGFNKLYILAIDATLLWRYVAMLLWPTGLCVLYDPPAEGIAFMAFLATAAWGLVGWTLWTIRHRAPLATLAGAAWILLLFPVLNFFPLTTLMNDRYLYLPCVPFFALTAGLVQSVTAFVCRRSPLMASSSAILATAASIGIVGGLTWSTLTYLPVWKDPVSLWSHARTLTPSLPVVHIQWAITLRSQGRFDEAMESLQYAIDHCAPDELDLERIERHMEECRRLASEHAASGAAS